MVLETAALISIGNWLGNKLLDKGFDSIYSKVTSKDFNKRFYIIVEQAIEKLQKKHPDAYGGNIEFIFKHEDVFNELIKLLFLNSKINLEIIHEKFDNETLPDDFILEFINLLRDGLYADNYFRDILANKELYLTTIGINENVEEVMKITTLSLEEVKKIKSLLESKLKVNFSHNDFIERYKDRLTNNLSQVNFIGLGVDLSIKKGKRKSLEDLFVKPSFSTNKDNLKTLRTTLKSNFKKEILKFEEIFDYTQNLIILGNPGSGKSTITKFITVKLSKGECSLFNDNPICKKIPFRIELSKYFAFKKSNQEGIVKYLRHQLEVEYGFSNILLEELIYILENHHPLVIFDGLDEIFDVTDRLTIKSDIENFSKEYPAIRTITTSRIIGYEESALNEENALRLVVNSFNDDQIEKYVKNWYEVEEEEDEVRKREISDLLSKRNLISNELISNPLLLSLIVILYRNNLKVPESKLEIYQSCTKTLVDKWDNSKNIKINLPEEIYKRKDTIFADLAYWQYGVLSSAGGKVTYQRAKNTITKSLNFKLKLTDEFTSDLMAEKFLEYAQKRSLYFDNNFTHKTFLEYYTAYWIFTNIEKKHKKEERNDLIAKYVETPFWHIVLELLINLIDKDQADNEILDDLISEQLLKRPGSYVFFLQIFDTIKNSSIEIFKKIAKMTIEGLLYNVEIESRSKRPYYDRESSTFYLLTKYYSKEIYTQSIDECFMELHDEIFLNKPNITTKELGIDIKFVSLYLELIQEVTRHEKPINTERILFKDTIQQIRYKDPFLFIISTLTCFSKDFAVNLNSYANEFLQSFGAKNYTEEFGARFANFFYFPFQRIILRDVLRNKDSKYFDEYIQLVEMHELDKSMIIKDIFNNTIFISNQNEFENSFDKLNTNVGLLYKELFFALAYSSIFNRYSRSTGLSNIKASLKVIKNHDLREELLNIVSAKNESAATNYLVKVHGIEKNLIKEKVDSTI